jgi:ATP-binding cassette subfamily B protein
VRLVLSGALTLGDLLLVMGYLAQLYGPLNTLSNSKATLQSSLASAERAFSILDEAPDVVERPGAQPLTRASGAVAFRDVSFAYRENHPVLHDVSFEVDPGTRVGISGETGAGKTTLMSLLTRFYDPTTGEILLDGIDLRDYKLTDLRNQFAIVLQEPVLFSTSIAENIGYARPSASEGEVVEAAKAANAHEFIVDLPRGYGTEVGERGMSLSGGERQRIALARAFLRDAPILILDEPTSSVDTRTEAAIMEAMERLMHGRTTFMIAHRVSTLASCDARLELADGRVVRFEQRTPPTDILHRSRETS